MHLPAKHTKHGLINLSYLKENDKTIHKPINNLLFCLSDRPTDQSTQRSAKVLSTDKEGGTNPTAH